MSVDKADKLISEVRNKAVTQYTDADEPGTKADPTPQTAPPQSATPETAAQSAGPKAAPAAAAETDTTLVTPAPAPMEQPAQPKKGRLGCMSLITVIALAVFAISFLVTR